MKRTTLKFVAILVAAIFLFSGCDSLKKMLDRANEVKYNVTPNPLEMHAEKVAMNLSVTFPAKYFIKKAIVVITPVLKAKEGNSEKAFKTFSLRGEKVDENYKMVNYETGGTVTFTDTIPYEEVYRYSELEFRIKANKDKSTESVGFGTVKPNVFGVITTPHLVQFGTTVDNTNADGTNPNGKLGKMITTSVTLDPTTTAYKDATIFYDLQQSYLKPTEATKKEIKEIVETIKALSTDKEKNFTGVRIASYASPDGPQDLNANLVKERGKTANNFIIDELKKAKVDSIKKANFVTSETTADEDWDGFQKTTQASNIKDKELVLRVLSMYSDPQVREKEIKNIAEAYTDLKVSVLPQLRRSIFKVSYETKAKTDNEIVALASSDPDKLKEKELFHAAEVVTDPAKKIQFYTLYTNKYPNDWKGFNNLGVEYARQGKFAEAKTAFEKAKALDPQNAGLLNNLGVVALANGEYSNAEMYFMQAKTEEANYNLGIIRIKQGKYDEAYRLFGSKPSFNKGLAQILKGDAKGAESTLKAIGEKNIAALHYLKAIAASRNGLEEDVMKFLKAACDKDASWKEYAKKDVEFIKYFEKDTFKAIVQ